MAIIRQTNFLAGELAQSLWGRTDSPLFQVGLRKCRNFFVSRHGPVVSRPGTMLVAPAKKSDGVRLLPFVFSDTESYCLEFGDGYLRFHTQGGVVLSGGSPYELATPYLASELSGLQWAQSGDILTLAHPSHQPYELRRHGTLDWELVLVFFERPAPDFANAVIDLASAFNHEDQDHPSREWEWVATQVFRDSRGRNNETKPFKITLAAVEEFAPWSPFIQYEVGKVVTYNGTTYRANVALPKLGFAPDTGSGGAADWVPDAGTTIATNPPRLWAQQIPRLMVVYKDRPVTITFNKQTGLTAPSKNGKVVAYRVYRGRGGVFGWVGDCVGAADKFVDYGDAPDYGLAPPEGFNPFAVYDDAGNKLRDEYPRTVAYFQERLVFGGTTQRPGFIWASTTGDYDNFDIRRVVLSSMALTFELAARKREIVNGLVGLNRLLVLTNSSIWAGGGAGSDPLTPDSVEFAIQEEVGALPLQPVVMEGAALYVRAKGQGVRGLVFDNTGRAGYVGVDLSHQAAHMFQGLEVKEWAYAEDPWGLVWCVRNDGKLLTLTFSQEEKVWGWATHDTDGFVESICSVPETDEDAVYLGVRRGSNLLIERMTTRVDRGNAADSICTDSSVFYSVGTLSKVCTGLGHLEGKQVYALPYEQLADGTFGPGIPEGPLTVAGGQVTLSFNPLSAESGRNVLAITVGLFADRELETLDAGGGAEKLRQKTVVAVGFEVDRSKGLKVGQDFDHLVEWRQRSVSDGYKPFVPSTELVRVPVKGTWDLGARAALRQSQPLPVTVLGLIRDVDLGG